MSLGNVDNVVAVGMAPVIGMKAILTELVSMLHDPLEKVNKVIALDGYKLTFDYDKSREFNNESLYLSLYKEPKRAFGCLTRRLDIAFRVDLVAKKVYWYGAGDVEEANTALKDMLCQQMCLINPAIRLIEYFQQIEESKNFSINGVVGDLMFGVRCNDGHKRFTINSRLVNVGIPFTPTGGNKFPVGLRVIGTMHRVNKAMDDILNGVMQDNFNIVRKVIHDE